MNRKTVIKGASLLLGGLIVLGACGGEKPSTVAAAPPPTPPVTTAAPTVATQAPEPTITTAAPTVAEAPAPTPAPAPAVPVDANEILVESFAKAYAAYNPAALTMVAPATRMYVYVDGAYLLRNNGESSTKTAETARRDGGSWVINGVTFSEFVVENGLITDVKRNGAWISSTVAPGGGQVYESVPGQHDDWSGVIQGSIHSFRYFDGNLQALATTINGSSEDQQFRLENYAANGTQQFTSSSWPSETVSGVTRTVAFVFEGAPAGGGVVHGNLTWDKDIQAEVPGLG